MSAIEIERSSGNVYADLDLPDAEGMHFKAQLAGTVSEIIKTHRWTQQQAAEALAISQPALSQLMRGQFRGISEEKMRETFMRGKSFTI